MENFWYLFAAYSVIWLVLFGYLYSLYTRQRRLKQELNILMQRLDSGK